MRRYARASSAGSTQRQATGLGRFFRGADATRGTSPGAAGSGAPSLRHPALLAALTVLFALAIASVASAAGVVVKSIGNPTLDETSVLGGAFNTARGIDVNQSGAGGVPAGTFYVVDSTNNRVQRFAPTGAFVSAWGWGVKDEAAEYEICTQAANCMRGKSGAGAGEFGVNGAQGIAVDQGNGDVYVSDQIERRIDVFSATGTFIGAFGWGARDGTAALQFCTAVTTCHAPSATAPASGNVPGGQFGSAIGGLDVDESHGIYVANKTSRRIDVFKPVFTAGVPTGIEFVKAFGWGAETGAAAFQVCTAPTVCHAPAVAGNGEGQFATNSPTDVAIDSEGNIFALDGPTNKRIQEFSSTPAPIAKEFGAAALSATFGTGEPLSLAIDRSDNHVFVSGKRSTASSHVAVLEMDHTGGAVQAYGEELTPTAANGLAVAYAPNGGNVYLTVATNFTLQGVYAMNSHLPSVSTPSLVTAHSATLHGSVVSEEVAVGYHFEYSVDGANWTSAPASDATVPATPGTVAVEQAVSGLVGSQEYQIRLAATRPAGAMTIHSAPISFTTEPSAPEVIGASASAVGVRTALLTATVNPQNQPTTYRFQVGTEDCSVHSCATLIEDSAGSGGVALSLANELSGLSPDTTYHFRVLATNATGTTPGPDQTFTTYSEEALDTSCSNQAFRTGFGEVLPDCRAYERATPADKNGANIQGSDDNIEASSAGDRVTFYLNGGLATTGTPESIYMASRGPDGWSSDGLVPPSESQAYGSLRVGGWSEDLATSVSVAPTPSGEDLDLRDGASGAFRVGVSAPLIHLIQVDGFAADSSHLIFEGRESLLPEAPSSGESGLYDLNDGTLTLAGRIPASGTSCNDASGPACVVPPGGTFASPAGNGGYAQNTISRDGSKVFFKAESTGQLYVREDRERTVEVSASQATTPDPNGEEPAEFREATPSGSKVFFTSCEKLTNDSTAVSTGTDSCATEEQGRDLYSYDTETGELEDLSVDPTLSDAKGAAVLGVLGTSEDGSSVYFAANGVLAPGASAGNCKPFITTEFGSEECNLYLSRNGTVSFIASLVGGYYGLSDEPDWALTTSLNPRTARVSADGSTVLFSTFQSLTAYQSDGTRELYRWTASDDKVECVSCNPTGAAPSGEATFGTNHALGLFASIDMTFLTRNLSADGKRAFFESPDALLPNDTNGVTDVYEWEAKGEGSCESESTNGGCLYLVSSGRGADPSYFGDASRNGNDVFFFTSQSLVPGDGDELLDIYDASVGGGLASQHELTPPTCSGVACQANPAPPGAPNTASSAFRGPGNAKSPPSTRKCPKGKRKVTHRGKTRCVVRKHRRHRRRHSSHRHHARHHNRANTDRGGSK